MMEELDKKLLSKDPTVIASIFCKVVEYIRENHTEGKEETAQLTFLLSKCLSSDSKINEVATKGVLKLLKEEILDSDKVIQDFITTVPNNKISKGVVQIICAILYNQFVKSCSKTTPYKYNVLLPQHPLITLLRTSSQCSSYIHKAIMFASKEGEIQSWNMWNFHFYQYCFCNPLNEDFTYYKMRLWTYLLSSNQNHELVFKLLTWMPFDPVDPLLISAELLDELSSASNRSLIQTEVVLLLQVNVLYKLVSNNHDLTGTTFTRSLLTKMDRVDCVNPILLVLARTITKTSCSHALDILKICEILIDQPNINRFVLESIKAALLHWIGNPSNLIKDIVSKAREIYNRLENLSNQPLIASSNTKEVYMKYQDIIIPNKELFIDFELTTICESWQNKASILEFLTTVETAGIHLIMEVIHFVFGLFICDPNDTEITLATFKIICIYVENCEEFSHLVLTLILYVFSNTSNSKIHLELLQYLPKLASVRENYQKVVTTIKVLFSSNDNALKTFGMKLMHDLWRIDHNTYPLLEEMLTEEEPSRGIWEFYINKTHIIKQICEVNSKLYGEEMVAHLSRILNKCSEDGGELASSIALDAISVLCNEGVIDVNTTWMTLAPKYLNDKRTKTVKSMCGLAAVISHLLHPEHHGDLQREIICKMWDYATECPDMDVRTAALDALLEFGLENISPYFPEKYLKVDVTPKSDVTPQLIPGGSWIDFLKDQSNLTVAGDFLIKLIRKEVAEYPKYVYFITSKKEPTDYSLLPNHSLVRGIAEYCNSQVGRWKGLYEHVFIECMRILSQEYSKPLPPYNWSFLQQLFQEPELRYYCIKIACHQVIISGTARRFIENYIDTLTEDFENINEVTIIYENLKHLANSIQPTIFEEFYTKTLNHAEYLWKEKKNEKYLIKLIDALKDVLVNPSIQDVSKKGIVANIDAKIMSSNEFDEIFRIFMSCVSCYPTDLLKNITALPTAENMCRESYRKAVHIRCKLALETEDKLKWLDDLLDMDCKGIEHMDTLEEFLSIFTQQKNHLEIVRWIVDLIGRIEASMANSSSQSRIIFLVEVLIVSLVAFSGFYVFDGLTFDLDQFLKLLPQATHAVFNKRGWNYDSSQVIQCFYFLNMNKEKLLPLAYQNAFGQTLQALRHNFEFKKGNKWMKYFNANVMLQYFQ